MRSPPRISRIVTVFNQWHFLDWLAQDALFTSDTEFIVIDDCSATPAPLEVAARLGARGVTLHRLPRNSGRCVGRNTGAQIAAGDFVEFIDGDDRPLPLRANPSWDRAEVVFFHFEVHGIAMDPSGSWVRHPLLADPSVPEGFLDPRPAAVLWRRSTFLAYGGFDARFETAEDLELVLRTRTLPRAFCPVAKQSYNEQPRPSHIEIIGATARLAIYQRLPAVTLDRQRLIDDEVRNIHLHTVWHLLRAGHHRYLIRSALVLIWNVLKSAFRSPSNS